MPMEIAAEVVLEQSEGSMEPVLGLAGGSATRQQQIEILYATVARLGHERASRLADTESLDQFNAAFSSLRRLQNEEVEELKTSFYQSLELPIGEGERVISEVDNMLEKYADTPSQNVTAG